MERKRWTEDDLLNLITNQEEEGLNLEFKESAALRLDIREQKDRIKSDLSKDVSAMANSDGGTIIYGIKDKRSRGRPQGIADSIDEGLDPGVITKERVENALTSNIRPAIDRLSIQSVPLDTQGAGRVAYVIHIPESLRAPHQASDKRFYKRFNFKSEPMEEYEIRTLYFRTLAPDLELVLESESLPLDYPFEPTRQGNTYEWCEVQPVVTNHGHGAAEYSQYQYFVPTAALEVQSLIPTGREVEVPWKSGASWHTLLFEQRLIPGGLPIFPGERRPLDPFKIRFEDFSSKGPCMLLWMVRANNMRPRFGGLKIQHNFDRWRLTLLNEEQVAQDIEIERIR